MTTRTRKKHKEGFTLIEVILFLAISSAVLIAILSGTSRSLAQQRYNDSVQDLYSFLQSQYSSVINVENTDTPGGGRSEDAIYGKLVIFNSSGDASTLDSYTIIGNAIFNGKIVHSGENISDLDTEGILNRIDLRIICGEKTSYNFQWGAVVENEQPHGNPNNSKIETTVAIIRSPVNGTIYTYRADDALVPNCNAGVDIDTFLTGNQAFTSQSYPTAMQPGPFNRIPNLPAAAALNLCIYTEDEAYGDRRRNIRISSTGSINSIQLVPLDDGGDNQCQ